MAIKVIYLPHSVDIWLGYFLPFQFPGKLTALVQRVGVSGVLLRPGLFQRLGMSLWAREERIT